VTQPRHEGADAAGASPATPASVSVPHAPRNLSAVTGEEYLAPLTLVWVRHGVTTMTREHRLSGSSVPGPSLSARGRVQAAKAADVMYRIGRDTWRGMAPVSRIVASPMVRTQETAAALGRRLGLPVETDAAVREVDFGTWEGLTAEEAVERDGDALLRWQDGDGAAPGGESIADVGARTVSWAESAAHWHADTGGAARTVAVVSHAVAIKAAVGTLMGMDAAHAARMWPVPASYTMVQLRVTPTGQLAQTHLVCVGAPSDEEE